MMSGGHAEANKTVNNAAKEVAERLPDFLIIGAMKAGTTTLFELLGRHPRIALSQEKEPGYFSRPEVQARGRTWYASLFAHAGPDQLCGESSTCYSRWPHYGDVPGRIYRALPDVKLIYIMRHPVERAYSHYAHHMRHGVTASFEAALDADPAIIDASLYMHQIERFLHYFPRERFCLLTLDELQSEPTACLAACQRFLGVEVRDLLENGAVNANRAGETFARRRLLHTLRRVRRAPGVAFVADRCDHATRQRMLWHIHGQLMGSFIGRRLAAGHRQRLMPMSPRTRHWLLRRFEEDTRRLERFLERDLSAWFE